MARTASWEIFRPVPRNVTEIQIGSARETRKCEHRVSGYLYPRARICLPIVNSAACDEKGRKKREREREGRRGKTVVARDRRAATWLIRPSMRLIRFFFLFLFFISHFFPLLFFFFCRDERPSAGWNEVKDNGAREEDSLPVSGLRWIWCRRAYRINWPIGDLNRRDLRVSSLEHPCIRSCASLYL